MNHAVSQQICQAAGAVRNGGVVAYPTEFCYGLGCNPKHPAAVKRILNLKKRSPAKGMILIGSGLPQLTPFMAELPVDLMDKLKKSWPGAVTWLVPAAAWVPRWLKGNSDRIALRVPDHKLARQLCQASRHALVSTSANRSGQRPCRSAGQVQARFAHGIDYAILAPCGRAGGPSAIMDLVDGRVLR